MGNLTTLLLNTLAIIALVQIGSTQNIRRIKPSGSADIVSSPPDIIYDAGSYEVTHNRRMVIDPIPVSQEEINEYSEAVKSKIWGESEVIPHFGSPGRDKSFHDHMRRIKLYQKANQLSNLNIEMNGRGGSKPTDMSEEGRTSMRTTPAFATSTETSEPKYLSGEVEKAVKKCGG